ncbi:MAG: DUF2953 domain-containing protein [Firmicutes bacterium]|nr:DUF2953 domain-containing protein [Bacillota bacterium]
MKLFLTMIPFYFAIMLLIQLVPVRINLFFVRENKNDFMNIRVNTFFSLLRFNVEVPFIQQATPFDVTLEAELKAGQDKLVKEEKEKFSVFDLDWDKVQRVLVWVQQNKRLLWYITKFYTRAMTVEKVVLRVRAGMEDAALTGTMTGVFWTAAGMIVQIAQQRLHFKEPPTISFNPDFSPQPVFAARFDSVVSFRIGHFIIGSLLLLSTKIRGGKD